MVDTLASHLSVRDLPVTGTLRLILLLLQEKQSHTIHLPIEGIFVSLLWQEGPHAFSLLIEETGSAPSKFIPISVPKDSLP